MIRANTPTLPERNIRVSFEIFSSSRDARSREERRDRFGSGYLSEIKRIARRSTVPSVCDVRNGGPKSSRSAEREKCVYEYARTPSGAGRFARRAHLGGKESRIGMPRKILSNNLERREREGKSRVP